MSKEKISWKQKEQIIFICEILLFVIGSVLFWYQEWKISLIWD